MKQTDPVRWPVGLVFPARQHGAGGGQPSLDHGIENLVLGAEVVIEISARDPHRFGDIGEGGVVVTLPIDQVVGRVDDLLTGNFSGHRHRRHQWV